MNIKEVVLDTNLNLTDREAFKNDHSPKKKKPADLGGNRIKGSVHLWKRANELQ